MYIPCTANVKIHYHESPRSEVDFHVTGREMKFWYPVFACIKNDNENLRTSLKMLKYHKVLF